MVRLFEEIYLVLGQGIILEPLHIKQENATSPTPLSVLDFGPCRHVSPEVGRTHVGVIVGNAAGASPTNQPAIATGLEQTEF